MNTAQVAMVGALAGLFIATLLLAPLVAGGGERRGAEAAQVESVAPPGMAAHTRLIGLLSSPVLAAVLGLVFFASGQATLTAALPTPVAMVVTVAWLALIPASLVSLTPERTVNVSVLTAAGLCLMVLASITGDLVVAVVAAGTAGIAGGFIPHYFSSPRIRVTQPLLLLLGASLAVGTLHIDPSALPTLLSVGLPLALVGGAVAHLSVAWLASLEGPASGEPWSAWRAAAPQLRSAAIQTLLSAAAGRARAALQWTRKPVALVAICLVWTLGLAIILNLILERSQSAVDATSLQDRGEATLPLFVLGTLVIWLVVLGMLALVGRLWLTTAAAAAVGALVAVTHQEKLSLRLEPLFPSELGMIVHLPFLVEMVGLDVVGWGVAAVVAVLLAATLVGRWLSRWYSLPEPAQNQSLARRLLVARGVLVLVAGGALFHATQFNESGNLIRKAYDRAGAEWIHWDQGVNYAHNGFVAGALYNMPVRAMEEPEGYSEDALAEVLIKYAARADELNTGRADGALDDVNVLFVLSETFSDPLRMGGVQFEEDPIPYTRELMKQTASGQMLTSAYGGGTANVEFEALTGLSVANFRPQMHIPFQMLVPHETDFPSVAHLLEKEGHTSVAMHAYSSALYRRADAYRVLGFDKTVFAEDMKHQARVERSPFISDRALYDEVLDHLEATQEPLLLNVVSMQNHGPFLDRHDKPIRSRGDLPSSVLAEASQYATGLRHSDDALQTFIEQLEELEERTVVVFYGDHLPGFWPESVRQKTGTRLMHETPFFVYSNFGTGSGGSYGTLSPVYFANLVLEEVKAPLSPYHSLLRRMAKHLPGISKKMLIDADNQPITEDNLSAKARETLHDYRLVQYDLTIGEGFIRDELFRVGAEREPPDPLTAGRQPTGSSTRR
jgi:phosphoglycerol transferase MdoB-like AlkP superfamily enzyme